MTPFVLAFQDADKRNAAAAALARVKFSTVNAEMSCYTPRGVDSGFMRECDANFANSASTFIPSNHSVPQLAGCPKLAEGSPLQLSTRTGASAALGLVDDSGRLLTTVANGHLFRSGSFCKAILLASWRGWTSARKI